MNSIQDHAESMALKMDPDLAIPQVKAMLNWTTSDNTGETSVPIALPAEARSAGRAIGRGSRSSWTWCASSQSDTPKQEESRLGSIVSSSTSIRCRII